MNLHEQNVLACKGEQVAGMETNGSILLRAEDVAGLLQISRSQVFEMARRGEIPCVRIGRMVRYPAQAIRQWINGQIIMPK